MRKTSRHVLLAGFLAAALAGFTGSVPAQETAEEEEDLGWSGTTDLNLVVAKGNADSQTFGLDSKLKHHWKKANFQIKVDLFQIQEADDRFLLVEPGLTWEPGEDPPFGATRLVEPSPEVDTERFFVESKYNREIGEKVYWSLGASWDRNEDAGIVNRYIGFAGLGRTWLKREDLELATVWALSYTDREEDEVDPEKDQRFAGFRFSWKFKDKWGKHVVYTNSFTSNLSLKDTSDYSLDMVNSIAMDMSTHLALKVSLQALYESEPALEDVDVVAFVQTVDPDGIPGNGDEFFETVASGGIEVSGGSADIRKEEVDTIFKTSLVIKF